MSLRVEDAPASRLNGWMRALALAVAGATSLVLTLDPYVLAGVSASRVHTGLPLLMLGVSGAFIFGFGFTPTHRVARGLFHPALTWGLFGVGAALLALG
jgi:predicted membrane protein